MASRKIQGNLTVARYDAALHHCGPRGCGARGTCRTGLCPVASAMLRRQTSVHTDYGTDGRGGPRSVVKRSRVAVSAARITDLELSSRLPTVSCKRNLLEERRRGCVLQEITSGVLLCWEDGPAPLCGFARKGLRPLFRGVLFRGVGLRFITFVRRD